MCFRDPKAGQVPGKFEPSLPAWVWSLKLGGNPTGDVFGLREAKQHIWFAGNRPHTAPAAPNSLRPSPPRWMNTSQTHVYEAADRPAPWLRGTGKPADVQDGVWCEPASSSAARLPSLLPRWLIHMAALLQTCRTGDV